MVRLAGRLRLSPHFGLRDLRDLALTGQPHLASLHDREVVADDTAADRAQYGMAREVAGHTAHDRSTEAAGLRRTAGYDA